MSSKTALLGTAGASTSDAARLNVPSIKRLLVSRKQAAILLGGVDVSTIKRLEKAGILRARRLNPRSPTGQVFYAYEDVVTLALGKEAADA